jgi:hypothetical protein
MMPMPRRNRQRGGVTMLLIVVLILLAALVGALAVRGAFTEMHMSGSSRVARTSFYCAEAGLNVARPIIGANSGSWAGILNGTSIPSWYPIRGSIEGGQGIMNANNNWDYIVTIKDDNDETPYSANNLTVDNNLQVIIISDCIDPTISGMSSDMGGHELRELIQYQGNGGTDQRNQAGHSSTHSGNEN